MDGKSTFGAEPERIDRLLSIGLEGSSSGEEHDLTASMDFFTEKPGSRIGRYELKSVLGEGGMGIVYLAEQRHPIRRQLALKVIKPGMDSKRVIARFEAERQALALLEHPNIAHVYDAGTTEAGRPYFAMEYVKGLSITEHCDRHKLTIEDRLNLFRQVCLAVQHAHQKGIIHRDIKPSNILISIQDDQANPKIIDFGVAKALAQPLTEQTLATEESQLLGTPEYMSPEQADMVNEDIDTRSDIYSLGVLLYVLLTGALPFDSDTLRTGGIDRIRQIIREKDPKTPSTRLTNLGEEAGKVAEKRCTDVAALAKCLRKELEWIPLKAMRKERTDRYRSASEFADDIENYITGAPLIAGPLTTAYRCKKFLRRNRALVTGIAAVLAVLVAGVVVSTVFAIRAEQQAKISHAVNEFLQEDLIRSVDPHVALGREVTVRSWLDAASQNLEGRFENEPLVEASIRETLGDTYRNLGDYEAAERHLKRVVQIRRDELGEEHPQTIYATFLLCGALCGARRAAEVQPLCLKTVERSKRILGKEHRTTLLSMNMLAIVREALANYDEAEQLFREILQTSRKTFGQTDMITSLVVGNLANLLRRTGRYEEAEPLCLEALELRRQVFGEDHPFTIDSLRGLGLLRAEQQRYEEAEKLLTESLEKRRRVQGHEHERAIRNMVHLGWVYTEQQRYDEAEMLLLDAFELGCRVLGPLDQITIESIGKIVELYEAWNKPEKVDEWRAKIPKTEAVNE
ncbi:MAG: tetratricopeptide repeat protein [Planctomycetes bacterium]|nr:tetratricopeptide repeat protein [Planctomycetota bacterium]